MDEQPTDFDIEHAAYGKDRVRVLIASNAGHGSSDAARDITFGVRVSGRLEASYRDGDNAAILPSDTLRRHLLAVAAGASGLSLEAYCLAAAARLHSANAAFADVLVEATERLWRPAGTHTFVGPEAICIAGCRWTDAGAAERFGGVEELGVLMTRGSAFTGFLRDGLTVQAEAVDRPLAGALTARWGWGDPPGGVPELDRSRAVLGALGEALADRPSNAVQEWLTVSAAALLGAVAELTSVELSFVSLPIAPIPLGLGPGDPASPGACHEIGSGPLGHTEVRLRRHSSQTP